MTDRELLESAAKAAGYVLKFTLEGNGAGEAITYCEREVASIRWEESPTCFGYTEWNPLTDDGDALRLAVKLKLDVDHCQEHACVYGVGVAVEIPEEHDPYAATRRAIVRAAAEIGKEVLHAE